MIDTLSPTENYMFVKRLVSLPMVSMAVSQARSIVDSSSILKYTTDTAAVAVRIIANPIVVHLPVDRVDKFADSKLESLEKSMPIITISSEELMDQSKAYYSSSRLRPAIERVTSAATYGHDTVINLKNYSSQKIDSACSIPRRSLQKSRDIIKVALVNTEAYVEEYLPEQGKNSDCNKGDNALNCTTNSDKDKVQTISEQLFIISDKVRRRTTSLMVNRLVLSSGSILEKVLLTNNLIKIRLLPVISASLVSTESASSVLHSIITSTVGLVYDSSTTLTLEERLMATARQLTAMLGELYTTTISLIDQSSLNPLFNKHISDAQRYAVECFEALNSNTSQFHKYPREVLENAHTSLALFTLRIQLIMDNMLECRAAKFLVSGEVRVVDKEKSI